MSHKSFILVTGIVCATSAWAGECDSAYEIQTQMCLEANNTREREGTHGLEADDYLNNMAQEYAWRLAKYAYEQVGDGRGKCNYLTHDLPGHGFMSRMNRAGLQAAAENISCGYRSAQDAIYSWETSRGHAKNLFSNRYLKVGSGYYNGFWVQIYN